MTDTLHSRPTLTQKFRARQTRQYIHASTSFQAARCGLAAHFPLLPLRPLPPLAPLSVCSVFSVDSVVQVLHFPLPFSSIPMSSLPELRPRLPQPPANENILMVVADRGVRDSLAVFEMARPSARLECGNKVIFLNPHDDHSLWLGLPYPRSQCEFDPLIAAGKPYARP